ncbi:nitroreductase/quinone reductase family protein [Amycolatopsis pithecellobii]|uniref:nitroreductase/quinone reductase family protein n=1 Tax=Amycolatopsis pithecellobii TaxID=664692 RepID=UPI0028AA946D|nr:nitroreductase/quinone reductase family protein [Amycolatopsis pithecellobii]
MAKPSRTRLIYSAFGEDFVVASKGGADHDPAWFKDLQTKPTVGMQASLGRSFPLGV